MPYRKEDSRIYTETRDVFRKSVKDLVSQWEGMKENFKRDTGYFDRKAEALARAATNAGIVKSFTASCERRIHWLQVILGIDKVRIPKSNLGSDRSKGDEKSTILYALDKSKNDGGKFNYNIEDTRKKINLAKAKVKVVKQIKGLVGTGDLSSVVKRNIENIIKNDDHSEYKNMLEDLLKDIENAPSKTPPKTPVDIVGDRLTKLEREFTSSKKEEGKSRQIEEEFKIFRGNLQRAFDMGVEFVRLFYSQSLAKAAPISKLGSKTERMTEEAAGDGDPDEIIKSTRTSFMLANNQLKKDIINYDAKTSAIIDAWIDFHRFCEQHKSGDPVIDNEAQVTILRIRKANRANFFKDGLDQSQALLKTFESEALDAPVVDEEDNTESNSGSKVRPLKDRPIRSRGRSQTA